LHSFNFLKHYYTVPQLDERLEVINYPESGYKIFKQHQINEFSPENGIFLIRYYKFLRLLEYRLLDDGVESEPWEYFLNHLMENIDHYNIPNLRKLNECKNAMNNWTSADFNLREPSEQAHMTDYRLILPPDDDDSEDDDSEEDDAEEDDSEVESDEQAPMVQYRVLPSKYQSDDMPTVYWV
jgi:hypothetical protein